MKRNLPVKQFNEIKKTFQATKQNGFVTAVNARIVHEWLGVGVAFTTWIQRRIDKYNFMEHIDYCIVTTSKIENNEKFNNLRNGAPTKDYHCTPDMVKQLAMIENSEMGSIARKYFIDCEALACKLLLEKEERSRLKVEFRPMTDAVLAAHDDPKPYHYSNECDMINRIVLGMSAAQFRKHHELDKNESVRDYMTELQMKTVIELQRANTVFINMDEEFQERKEKLNKLFDKKYCQPLIEEIKQLEA